MFGRRVVLLVLAMLAVWAPNAAAQVSFAPPADFGADNRPRSVAVGDFDGDTNPDLAVANEDSDDVSVLLGDGTGSFAPATNFLAGDNPHSVAVGDFDGDTDLDLAVANLLSDTVSVLLGDGTGGFAAAVGYPAGDQPASVAVGDFNGDTKPDLAVANSATCRCVSVLLGTGTGTFGATTNIALGRQAYGVAVGDFNGDTKPDLAVALTLANRVTVLLGDGTGGFGAFIDTPATGKEPLSVAVGDFNGDSKPDLVTANFEADNVSLLLGAGTGTFAPAVNFPAGGFPSSVAVGDFDDDTNPDIAVANADDDDVSVLLGTGTGSFAAAADFPAGFFPMSVAVGHLDGDTRLDLVTANALSNDASVLLNTTPPPPTYAGTVLADDPAGYWRLGEASGLTAFDSSPNGNDGAYRNGPLLGQPGALAGDPDTAVRFDGLNDQVRIPDDPSLDVGSSFTAEGWIQRSSQAKPHQLMIKGNRGLHLVITADPGNQLQLRKANVTTLARSSTGVPADGRFHHVAATMNGPGTARLYIDGVDVTVAVPGQHRHAIENTKLPLLFGSTGSTRSVLDELALYDAPLTAAQILAHYAAGSP